MTTRSSKLRAAILQLGTALFVTLSITLPLGCLPSCTEYALTDQATKEVEATLASTALRITLDAAPHLKAYPQGEAEIKKQYHNFKGLRALFYTLDAQGKPDAVAYAFDFDITATRGEYSGRDYQSTSNPLEHISLQRQLKLRCNDYALYVIATPTEEIKQATAEGKSFAELQQSFHTSEWPNASPHFFHYHTYINSEAVQISKEQMSQTSAAQVYYTPEIKLTSVAAYLSVDWEPRINDPKYQILGTSLSYTPDVVNKKFFLLPNPDKGVERALQQYFPIDPNYQAFAGESESDLALEFAYLPLFKTLTTKQISTYRHQSRKAAKDDRFAIIPENTTSYQDAQGTKVTRLIVSARIYPKELYHQSLETMPESGSNTYKLSWLRYKGKNYLFQIILDKFQAAEKKEKSSGGTLTPAEKELLELMRKHLLYQNPADNKRKTVHWGVHTEDLDFYYLGRAYYAIPITHFSAEELKNHPEVAGAYGIVRNTHYRLNINSFATIGTPAPEYLDRAIDYNNIHRGQLGHMSITTPTERNIVIDELQ